MFSGGGASISTFSISGGITFDQNAWDTLIWDISIKNAGTATFGVAGHPNGNQDSAWVDTVGSIDGSISYDGDTPITTSLSGYSPYIKDSIGTRTDTVYYGQYLESGGISGLLDFDGSDDYIQYPLITIGVNETITFSLYRKINDYTSDSGIFVFGDIGSNMIKCTLKDTDIHFSTDAFPNQVKYSLNGLTEIELVCEVTKVGNTITNFTVNGSTLIQTGSTVFSGIGANNFIGSSGVVLANNVLIYDVTIGSIFNTIGYPAGNLNPAWEDTIGVNDGTVSGSPTTTTTSSVINFYRTSGTFDYTDPSDGSLVEGVSIPGTGLYTIPANGICNIGIDPIEGDALGLLDFDGIDDYVSSSVLYDVAGDQVLSFTCYITDISVFGPLFRIRGSVASSHWSVWVNAGILYIYTRSTTTTNSSATYDLTGLQDTKLEVIITKVGTEIISVTINNVDISIIGDSSTSIANDPGINIGVYTSGGGGKTYLGSGYIWNVNINNTHTYIGQPNGNLDSAWEDTTGTVDLTVYGSPSTIDLVGIGDSTSYTYFYPTCERAGTVLHDVTENSVHISVDTPSWSESLYGSDYLNQQGFVTKAESDTLGYDWETIVNTNPVILNDNTLVPLGQWEYVDLQDSEGENILDSEGEQLQVKNNI